MASDAARIRRSNRFRWSPQPHAVTADTKRSASGCTSAAATKALLGAVCFNLNLCVCVVVSASVHAASSPIPATSRCAPSCMQANNDDGGSSNAAASLSLVVSLCAQHARTALFSRCIPLTIAVPRLAWQNAAVAVTAPSVRVCWPRAERSTVAGSRASWRWQGPSVPLTRRRGASLRG